MRFEFDRRKSAVNQEKHGVSLAEAAQLWQEACLEVKARTVKEARFMAIGHIQGKLHACIYTVRGEVIRLISCRRAREKEAQLYHEHFKERISEE